MMRLEFEDARTADAKRGEVNLGYLLVLLFFT